MPLNPDYLMELAIPPVESVVSPDAAILYALSVGVGRNPEDPDELRYVYERDLRAFPTMPLVTEICQAWTSDPKTGITWNKVVHGWEQIKIANALPIGGRIVAHMRIADVIDKGEHGALLILERVINDTRCGRLLATMRSGVLCRADGGFGGQNRAVTGFDPLPSREPDRISEIRIPSNAALLYRLNQDRNPLHADPDFAKAAGFPRPILHGLGTFGFVAAAIIQEKVQATLLSMEARFSNPVFPGETLALDLWKNEIGHFQFRVRVPARNSTALDRGGMICRYS